ncbi:MAG: DNA primase [Clostridia bacterium]|nr:DNA primase [Clostridia bacterium]
MSTNRRGGVPPEFLQQLRDRVDIVPLISCYMQISRKGRNYWGCCPFHHEKTPSFCIYDEEQSFHCFGCGVSGDIFSFIMKIENLDFLDSVEILANKSGIPMPEFKGDFDIVEKKRKKDRFLSLLKDANEHYKSNLVKSQKALDYIAKRELTDNEIREFEIGYSSGWIDVIDYLLSKGYTENELLEIGIARRGDNGKLFDFYAFRLMFPLFNKFGDCVGFSGRDLDGTSPAKYKNSTQSIVFDKSSTIFAFNKVKKLATTQNIEYVILCEGQIDVIAMHKAGFNTAMACLGTALTEIHAKEISRVSKKVVLCLDGDNAGINATLKALPILRAQSLEVKVARIEGGKDPDEVIKVCGKEKMQQIINSAMDSVEFEIRELARKYNLNDIADRTKFISGAFKILSIFRTLSEKEVYIPIISDLSKISISVLRADLNQTSTDDVVTNDAIQDTNLTYKYDALIKSQQFILASLIYNKEYAKLDDDFDLCLKDPSLIKLYNFIKEKRANNEKINSTIVFDMFDEEEVQGQISDIMYLDMDSYGDDAGKHFKICVNKIINMQYEIELDTLKRKLNEEKDTIKQMEYLVKINEIIKKKKTKAEDIDA